MSYKILNKIGQNYLAHRKLQHIRIYQFYLNIQEMHRKTKRKGNKEYIDYSYFSY